jgi:hypothetical protein
VPRGTVHAVGRENGFLKYRRSLAKPNRQVTFALIRTNNRRIIPSQEVQNEILVSEKTE